MKIGVIADDFTGSSDIALMLAEGGMQTVQYVRTPSTAAEKHVEAGVISLKSRSCEVQTAIKDSLEALRWLLDQGAEQIIFKYCSTFDSTPEGNIGPVIDALANAMNVTDPVIVCPAFPATGRTIYQAHLFVFDKLLSESGMQNHPITPMTDSNLCRWLSHQTKRSVGHLPLNTLREGSGRAHLQKLVEEGTPYVVCDIAEDNDLITLAEATRGYKLLTGGSGIALGLPKLYNKDPSDQASWQAQQGAALALSGSCSTTTLSQIEHHKQNGGAHISINISHLMDGKISPQNIVDWALEQNSLPLVSTSDTPENVKALQSQHGGEKVANTIEQFFGEVAALAIQQGFNSLICAGGETSGAIVQALNIEALDIGPKIDPGVPALKISNEAITIALKSGNFGAEDFFAKAASVLSE